MKVKLNIYLYFNKLIKQLERKGTGSVYKLFLDELVKSSKDFIESDKVKPPVTAATLEKRRRAGRIGTTTLLDTGRLVDSIRATGKGITFANHGRYHRRGSDRLPKREFISIRASESEKDKLIDTVKNKLSKLIKRNLRKK